MKRSAKFFILFLHSPVRNAMQWNYIRRKLNVHKTSEDAQDVFWTYYVLLMPRNCLSVFDHFVGFALKGIITELILSFKVSRGAFSLFTSIEKTSFPESFLDVQ